VIIHKLTTHKFSMQSRSETHEKPYEQQGKKPQRFLDGAWSHHERDHWMPQLLSTGHRPCLTILTLLSQFLSPSVRGQNGSWSQRKKREPPVP